jgi:hypothetical protein
LKTLIIFLIIFLGWQVASAQLLFLPKFIRKMYINNDTGRKKSFVILPVLASAPETGIEAGGTALLSFYTDTANRKTRVSNIFAYATATTKGQERFNLSANYWTPQNKHYYTAAIGYQNFPFNFYGIGNNTRLANADPTVEKRFKLNFTSQKLLGGHIYAGYTLGGLDYAYSDRTSGGILFTSPLVEDKNGGTSVFAGPSLVYDTRDNNTYTTRGMIVTTYFNMMQGVFGNNSYTGGLFNVEYSQFLPVSRRLTLAIDAQEQSLAGCRSPFYLMPQLGSDEMMRGYYTGRYRDRNLLAAQTELRYRINGRFGIAAFAGAGEVFHTQFSFNELKPDYGGGLRYFFDADKGLSIRLDYGIGQKPAGEPRETGFYISLGQSF